MFRTIQLLVQYACVIAALLLTASTATARDWKYDHGLSFRADFVRLVGDMAVLKQNGEMLTIQLGDLSESDQAWVRSAVECAKQRDWTTYDHKVLHGRYTKLEHGKVSIRTRKGIHRIPLNELIEADRRLVTTFDEVPMVAGKSVESATKTATKPEATPAPATAKQDEDGYRVWTGSNGKKIAAEYKGKVGDMVLLATNAREYRVPLARLSPGDRLYVESMNSAESAVMFDDLEPENSVATSTTSAAAITTEAEETKAKEEVKEVAKINEHAEERFKDFQNRRAELSRAEAKRVAALEETRRSEREAEAKAIAEEHRKMNEERNRKAAEQRAEWERKQAESRARNTPTLTHTYVCDSCSKTFTTSNELGVGDSCPHCNTTFDILQDENGEAIDEGSKTRARGFARIAKLVIFGVLGLGSLIGWLAKQG